MNADYQTYLDSIPWKRIRKRKLKAVGHQCEACGEKKLLQIHHLTYARIFHELDSDLQVLCENCHTIGDALRVANKPPLPSLFTTKAPPKPKLDREAKRLENIARRKRRKEKRIRKAKEKATKNQAAERTVAFVNEFLSIVAA